MLISNTKRLIVRSPSTWLIFQINKRHNASASLNPEKLTFSYCHHASSLPLLYQTVAQKFDENANKYPNHECYVFRGMFFFVSIVVFCMNDGLI